MDTTARLREELATQAVTGVMGAGFNEIGARNLAAIMVLVGAAQICAQTHKPLYAVFRMVCLSMAETSSVDAAMSKIRELGPEMFGGQMGDKF